MRPSEVPLSTVPVGNCVLHEGRLWRVHGVTSPAFPDQSELVPTRDGRGSGSYLASCAYLSLNTLVTSLVGDAPRLLTDADVGAWVYVVDWDRHSLPEPLFFVARNGGDTYHDRDGWGVDPDWPVWIVQSALEAEPALRAVAARQDHEKDFISPDRPRPPEPAEARWWYSELTEGIHANGSRRSLNPDEMRRTVALLNEHAPEGLPEPEPERPTVDVIADGLEAGIPLEYALAKHGYAVVDRLDTEVAKAIEWLVGDHAGPFRSGPHISTLLRVLGQEVRDE